VDWFGSSPHLHSEYQPPPRASSSGLRVTISNASYSTEATRGYRTAPSAYTQSLSQRASPAYGSRAPAYPRTRTMHQGLLVPASRWHQYGSPPPTLKRQVSQTPLPDESPAKTQFKWTPEEGNLTIKLRGQGMKWDDIAKRLPGRSSISCPLRYQNYIEKQGNWYEEKKSKLAAHYAWYVSPDSRLLRFYHPLLRFDSISLASTVL